MVTQEFQAVVLAAGRGTRLPEVLADSPKCLLPIGPYPLLWYPLNMLQQHNFQDAIVVVLENERSEIQQAIERTPLKIKIDFVAIDSDSDFGTADSLRIIHDKIKSDFLVLSCDIVSNVSLYPLINKFRQHDAALTALLFKSGFESDVTLPGPKTKHKPERDLIGIHPDSNRLLFLASTSDFEEVMSVNAHLLRKNGKITIFSRLVDSHIYVMKKWTIDFLLKKENFSTLKGEFLPYLIKKQMSKKSGSSAAPPDMHSEVGVNIKLENDIFHYASNTQLEQRIQKATLFNDSRIKEPYNGDLIRCYAVVAPKESLGVRVNTTLSFFAINQKISNIWPKIFNDQEHALISSNAVINSTQTKEIAVGDSAKLSEKTSLNFSVFGANCTINPKNIVNKSIIMTSAIIEEGCNIDNCIVGSRAVVKRGCVLKNCLIGPSYAVEEGTKRENQHLTNADGFMEIDIQ
ncbi:translation initiation factor eIF-2B subunit gamma [Zeugodacus cucurbitae]|uniref:Translation initiation factor eIF2B subunit gamma n=1 Tax=Zeugodacus cucurbitae TaxID=28588 RepID=A0A0A1XII4_ZEUCU|nr:translation initiation factor eIF-2B subunit gamma [Zeugodacus cucurbitae]